MDIQKIANSTFNCENSFHGFHTFKLTEDEHKALTDALKENEILKEEVERLKLLINPRLLYAPPVIDPSGTS